MPLEDDSLNVYVLPVMEIAVKLFDFAENEQDRWDCVAHQLGGGGLWIAHVLPIAWSSKRLANRRTFGFAPLHSVLSSGLRDHLLSSAQGNYLFSKYAV